MRSVKLWDQAIRIFPELVLLNIHRTVQTFYNFNFGDRPFKFNIEEHCRSLFNMDRFLTGAKCLPPELQFLVLRFAIEDTEFRGTKHIPYRLSLVCHSWHQECTPALNHTITPRFTRDISSIPRQGDTRSILVSKTPIYKLSIDTSRSPSSKDQYHSFEEQFLSLEFSLLCMQQRQLPFLAHIELKQNTSNWKSTLVPLKLDRALPALLRPWKSITSLTIRDRTFDSFLHLSRVITALPMLHRLMHVRAKHAGVPAEQGRALRHRGEVHGHGLRVPRGRVRAERAELRRGRARVRERDVYVARPAVRGCRGRDEPVQGVPEQQRQVVPGVVPGPQQLEPVRRPPDRAHRRVAVWVWWDVFVWYL